MKKVGSPLEISLVIGSFVLIILVSVILVSMITQRNQVTLGVTATASPIKVPTNMIIETAIAIPSVSLEATTIPTNPTPTVRSQDQETEEYLKVASVNIIIIQNTLSEVSGLMSKENIKITDSNWQTKIASLGIRIGVIHEEFVAMKNIPPSMSNIHSLLVDATSNCSDSWMDLSVGYMAKSEEYLNKAAPLTESCIQKYTEAMQLLAQKTKVIPVVTPPVIEVATLNPTVLVSTETPTVASPSVEASPEVPSSNLIIDVKTILGRSVKDVEKILGVGKYPTPFQANSLSSFSGAGEARNYQINKYGTTIY